MGLWNQPQTFLLILWFILSSATVPEMNSNTQGGQPFEYSVGTGTWDWRLDMKGKLDYSWTFRETTWRNSLQQPDGAGKQFSQPSGGTIPIRPVIWDSILYLYSSCAWCFPKPHAV